MDRSPKSDHGDLPTREAAICPTRTRKLLAKSQTPVTNAMQWPLEQHAHEDTRGLTKAYVIDLVSSKAIGRGDDESLVCALLKHGASLDVRRVSGESPLCAKVIDILKECVSRGDTAPEYNCGPKSESLTDDWILLFETFTNENEETGLRLTQSQVSLQLRWSLVVYPFWLH